MKPEDQIIAIAAACGWHPDTVWQSVGSETHCIFRKGDELRTTKELPDWLNSLDAMHEAERHLGSINNLSSYADELDKICVPTHICPTTHWQGVVMSTAAQRAEAFLRAIGQWRGE